MRPTCLPHATMREIPARFPLPRQGLEQAVPSGVRPLAILAHFLGATPFPRRALARSGVPGPWSPMNWREISSWRPRFGTGRSSQGIQPRTRVESWDRSPEFDSGRRERDWGSRRSSSPSPKRSITRPRTSR